MLSSEDAVLNVDSSPASGGSRSAIQSGCSSSGMLLLHNNAAPGCWWRARRVAVATASDWRLFTGRAGPPRGRAAGSVSCTRQVKLPLAQIRLAGLTCRLRGGTCRAGSANTSVWPPPPGAWCSHLIGWAQPHMLDELVFCGVIHRMRIFTVDSRWGAGRRGRRRWGPAVRRP